VSVTDSLTPREQDVVRTLVRLADTMDADFELAGAMAELTRDCVRLLGVTAAGLLLAGPRGRLAVVAASSDESHALEVAQLEVGEGPGIDCYRTGLHVAAGDLGSTGGRWPNLAATAAGSNFRTAYTFPMRLRRDVIGALTLFSTDAADFAPLVVDLGQALADMATITILRERAFVETTDLAAQLQTALSSRVILEQAKGVLAERGGLSVDDAFRKLRKYARDRNLRLDDVSRAIIDNTIDPSAILGAADGRAPGVPTPIEPGRTTAD